MPRVGSGSVQNLTGRVGSGRVKTFQIALVKSGRVKSFSNVTGRGGSGLDFFKSHEWDQVGSGDEEQLTGRVRS